MMHTVSPGNEDVGVRGLAAAVDDDAVHAVREDQQGALRREHADLDAGEVRDALAPDAGGIDGDGRVVLAGFMGLMVVRLHAHHAVAVLDEAGDFGIEQDLGAVELGVHHVGGAQAERVHAAVRHLDGADDVRVHGRFHPEGLLRVHDLRVDARGEAGFDKLGLVVQVVLRQGDEEAVGLVHAVGRDPAEDHVLADALVRGLLVGHGIAGAGVQQAVVPARRSGGDVMPLDEEDLQSAHRAVSRRPGTGDAAADDDDVVLVPFHLMFNSLCVCSDSRHRGCR